MRPMLIVGYLLGVVMFVVGLLVLLGYFQFRGSQGSSAAMVRTIFGIVLLLYGLYRIAVTDTRRRREGRVQ